MEEITIQIPVYIGQKLYRLDKYYDIEEVLVTALEIRGSINANRGPISDYKGLKLGDFTKFHFQVNYENTLYSNTSVNNILFTSKEKLIKKLKSKYD